MEMMEVLVGEVGVGVVPGAKPGMWWWEVTWLPTPWVQSLLGFT